MASRTFYPPRPSVFLIGVAKRLLPWFLRRMWGIVDIEVSDSDWARLRELASKRALIVCNHPTLADPAILFHLLGRANSFAYTLSAWDTIAQNGWFIEYILPRLGCYSVMRGRPDRASIRMTRELLVSGERIVFFPEGVTYGLNDLLLPFQQGMVQIGFHALEDVRDKGVADSILVAPVAIKYVYSDSMDQEIDASLRRLEGRLGLDADGMTPYTRLLQVATAIIDALERELRLEPASQHSLADRIDRLRETMVHRLAEALDVHLPAEVEGPAAVQLLANAYDDAVLEDPRAEGSEYERELHTQTVETIKPLHAMWLRLKNFLAVRDGYVDAFPTQERFLDVLGRLEVEVLGKSRISGRRRAIVRLGDPLDLSERLDEYLKAKRPVVEATTREVERRVERLLGDLAGLTTPITSLATR